MADPCIGASEHLTLGGFGPLFYCPFETSYLSWGAYAARVRGARESIAEPLAGLTV